MLKEEAIKFLELDKKDRGKCFISDAIDMAIKALEQELTRQELQAESDKFDAAFQDGYNNGYAQGRFDYEQEQTTLGVDAISRAEAQTEIEMNASRYTLAKERGGMGQVEWILPPVTSQEPRIIGEWLRMSDLSEQEDDRYKYSRCRNVIHHKNEMDLYTFNSWCGKCGSDNGRHIIMR